MTFTLHEGSDKSRVYLSTNTIDAYEAFSVDTWVGTIDEHKTIQEWRKVVVIEIPTNDLYRSLSRIAFYVNSELGEEFLIEID